MPNKNINNPNDLGVPVKYVDNGDGTYSEQVAIGSSPTYGKTPTDRSGTIQTNATAQQLMPANSARRGFWIQNQSVADLWINELGTAAAQQPSYRLVSGATYESPSFGVPTGAIMLFCATQGQPFAAREY